MTGVNGLLDPHGTELLVHPVRYCPDRPDVVNDMREVDEAQAHALRAVAIGRTYAATGGAHQCVSRVVEPVEREDDCCALADEEALARLNSMKDLHALGRIGEVSEVAEAVGYFLSAEWVTGAILEVDGGLALGLTKG